MVFKKLCNYHFPLSYTNFLSSTSFLSVHHSSQHKNMVSLFPILEKQQQQQTLSLSSPLHLCINSQKNSMPLLLRPRE